MFKINVIHLMVQLCTGIAGNSFQGDIKDFISSMDRAAFTKIDYTGRYKVDRRFLFFIMAHGNRCASCTVKAIILTIFPLKAPPVIVVENKSTDCSNG